MDQALAKFLRKVQLHRKNQFRDIRKQTDAIRRRISAKSGAWDSTKIIRATRDSY